MKNTGENIFFNKLITNIRARLKFNKLIPIPNTTRGYRGDEIVSGDFLIHGKVFVIPEDTGWLTNSFNMINSTTDQKIHEIGFFTYHNQNISEMVNTIYLDMAFYNPNSELIIYLNLKFVFTNSGVVQYIPELSCFPPFARYNPSCWSLFLCICVLFLTDLFYWIWGFRNRWIQIKYLAFKKYKKIQQEEVQNTLIQQKSCVTYENEFYNDNNEILDTEEDYDKNLMTNNENVQPNIDLADDSNSCSRSSTLFSRTNTGMSSLSGSSYNDGSISQRQVIKKRHKAGNLETIQEADDPVYEMSERTIASSRQDTNSIKPLGLYKLTGDDTNDLNDNFEINSIPKKLGIFDAIPHKKVMQDPSMSYIYNEPSTLFEKNFSMAPSRLDTSNTQTLKD